MNDFAAHRAELIEKCPAQTFIRKTIRQLVKVEDATAIRVNDGDEWVEYATDNAGVKEAAAMTIDIDGLVHFRVGKAAFIAINDGPYDRDTRAESIVDHNNRFGEIVGEIWE